MGSRSRSDRSRGHGVFSTSRASAASPDALDAPDPALVQWDTAQVTACTVSDGTTTLASGGTDGAVSLPLDVTTHLTLSCDAAGGGTLTSEIVVPVGPSIVHFSDIGGDPLGFSVRFGTHLVDSCVITGVGEDGFRVLPFGFGELVGGCDFRGPCDGGAGYDFGTHGDVTVTATCTAGITTLTESLVIAAGPAIPSFTTFSVDPIALPTGGGTTEICWASADADQCSLNGEPVALSGCETRDLTETTVFNVLCANENGPRDRGEQVLVGPGVARVTLDRAQVILDVDPTATVTWESNEVVSCTYEQIGPGSVTTAEPVLVNGSTVVTFADAGDQYVRVDCFDEGGNQYTGSVGVQVF